MSAPSVKRLAFNGSEHYHSRIRARAGTDAGYDHACRSVMDLGYVRVQTPQGWQFVEMKRSKATPRKYGVGECSRNGPAMEYDELDWTPKKYREMDTNFCTALDKAISKGQERAQRTTPPVSV